jgi:hypothetical protein
MKVVMAPPERIEKIVKSSDFYIGRRAQAVDPGVKIFGILDLQRLVRTKGGEDTNLEIGCGEPAMGFKIVARIVGSFKTIKR